MSFQRAGPYAQQQPQQQFQQQPQQPPPGDWIPGHDHRYVLTNFKIAHEKVEQQRRQLEEQERQVAQLRSRISLLEGSSNPNIKGHNGNTVDDFSIKNSASQLDKLINRWATEIVRAPPVPLERLCAAILNDIVGGLEANHVESTPMQVQNYLRHAISEVVSEGVINCLIVTNSTEANVQLTRIHEHLFARDPTVACVWRRQTFSAAVESCTPDMSVSILQEHLPTLMEALSWHLPSAGGTSILESAYTFSRMLHGAASSSTDTFYRAFVPELGTNLYPSQIELVKRCPKSERGEPDRVGATIFPGLVKVSRASSVPGTAEETVQTVVRRAQVICECALGGSAIPIANYDVQQGRPGPSMQQTGFSGTPQPEYNSPAQLSLHSLPPSDVNYDGLDLQPSYAPQQPPYSIAPPQQYNASSRSGPGYF